MNYRRLGHSGLQVSELCLGAWINFGGRIEDPEVFAVLDTAVESGINFFDTADIYAGGKAEEVMGRWMKDKDRRTIVLATKCWGKMWEGPNGRGLSRKHIMEACDDSLRRLQTDYIDVYQAHAPDNDTPLEETMHAFNDLVQAGKVLYIGCSNFSSEMIGEAARISERYGWHKFISSQPYYNMLGREVEESHVPRCLKEGLGLIPYSPLAQGLLSDKYLSGTIPTGSRAEGNESLEKLLKEKLPILQKLGEFAHTRDLTLSQLAVSWLLHQPSMAAPIIGASKPEQVQENVKAAEVKLSTDELAKLDTILKSSSEEASAA
jgi:aryl-alcohol dehydrogenase-like predicted oxidoreductase